MSEAGTVARSRPHVLGPRGPRPSSPLTAAIGDVVEGAVQWPQWFTLGNLDVKLRFRRTGLGPLWNTLSFTILVAALSAVYSRVLGEDPRFYLSYLVLGLFVWNFLSTAIQEACDAFVNAEHLLKQMYVPRSSLIYRLLWRNIVVSAFNLVTVAAVLLLCRIAPGRGMLLAGVGAMLLLANLAWATMLVALAATRFRAVTRLVGTSLPILMLITPVIWRPSHSGLKALADLNPIYHAIELVRGPLTGSIPAASVWIGAAVICAAGSLITLVVFSAVRSRITYWL